MSVIIFDLYEERARRRTLEVSSSNLDWQLSQRNNPYVAVNEAFHIVLGRRPGLPDRGPGNWPGLVLGAPVWERGSLGPMPSSR
jgi:hypothetical protein